MRNDSLYKAGDIVRFPTKSDCEIKSWILTECYGYECEVRKDDDGYYIYVIKQHNTNDEIENNVYQIGELKVSHFCNRKVAKSLIKTIIDNGFLLTRSGSDEKYVYLDAIKVVGNKWQL